MATPIVFARLIEASGSKAEQLLGSVTDLSATLTDNGDSTATVALACGSDLPPEVASIGFAIKKANGNIWPLGSPVFYGVGETGSVDDAVTGEVADGEVFTVSVGLRLNSDSGDLVTQFMQFAKLEL